MLINNRYDIVITAYASYANDTNIKRAILLYTYVLELCNLLRLWTHQPPLAHASHTPYYTMTRIRELLLLHGLFKIYFIAKTFFLQSFIFFLVIMQFLVLCKHLQCIFFFYCYLWFSKLWHFDFELFVNFFNDFPSATIAWTRWGIFVTNLVPCLKEKQLRKLTTSLAKSFVIE